MRSASPASDTFGDEGTTVPSINSVLPPGFPLAPPIAAEGDATSCEEVATPTEEALPKRAAALPLEPGLALLEAPDVEDWECL